jgi:hypothetical protein
MRIDDAQIQMTLDLDTNLTERFRSAKEAMAAGVYRRGLKRVAADLDVAPGNLSVMLSDDGQRHLGVDLMEKYIQHYGDLSPIYFLVAKYCGDSSARRDEAIERMQGLLAELPQLLASVGAHKRKAR